MKDKKKSSKKQPDSPKNPFGGKGKY